MSIETQPLVLGEGDHGRPVGSEEFARADFVGPWRYERVAGRLLVMAPDGKEHDDVSETFRDYLGAYRLGHPEIVERVVSEAWVRVDGGKDRIADIAIYLARPGPGPDRPDRVPDLVIEVVSESREDRDRDYVLKRAEYHALGVREYVIADRFEGKVTTLSHGPDGYDEVILGPDDTYATPLLPGLAVPLDEVL